MPNVSAHIGCALKVKERLNIKDDRFILGALLPDIIDDDKRKTHFKIRGKEYLIPNLEYYKNNFDIKNPQNCGYFFHLYLDYYFLEEYLYENNKGTDVFYGSTLYNDYDIINKSLVDHFKIDIPYVENTLIKYSNNKVSRRKLDNNIRCLKLNEKGNTNYIYINKFIPFLDKIVDKFINEYKDKI